jgi:hypothetical protein
VLNNPYAGLALLVALLAAFAHGLLFVPARHWFAKRTAFGIAVFTAANIAVVLLAGAGTLRWMESPRFCGQTCHTPMQPQFTAWQDNAHANTACVSCHVGEGPRAVVRAKLAGVRQLAHVVGGSYARPIPPGADMPPGAQATTCRGCHAPERGGADIVRVTREYADDEANTETASALQLHLAPRTASRPSIHWHADPAVRVEYVATDAAKETIPYVRVTAANGSVREFVAEGAGEDAQRAGELRTMDCVDCHNTVGHPIAATPEQAVDRAIAAGLVSRQLPHARREGVRLVKAEYASEAAAAQGIADGFRGFYKTRAGPVDERAVEQTVTALQAVYRRNVFPEMKVTFGSYPDNRGHLTATGCFRCHDGSHVDKAGAAISADCEYCHTQMEAPAAVPPPSLLTRRVP